MKTFYCALILLIFCACVPAVMAEESYTFVAKWGAQGSGDGQFLNPYGIAVDGAGNVYVSDSSNHRVQMFTSAGTFLSRWGGYGSGDGRFYVPFGIAVDVDGNVYVAEKNNHRVQKFDSNGAFVAK